MNETKGHFSAGVVSGVGSILFSISVANGQEATSERIIVQADRLPDVGSAAAFSVEVVTAEELERAPQLRLDCAPTTRRTKAAPIRIDDAPTNLFPVFPAFLVILLS